MLFLDTGDLSKDLGNAEEIQSWTCTGVGRVPLPGRLLKTDIKAVGIGLAVVQAEKWMLIIHLPKGKSIGRIPFGHQIKK